jgi:hypothetical protein
MPKNKELSQEDQEKLSRLISEFSTRFQRSGQTLDDFAFLFWDSASGVSLGDSTPEAVLAHIEGAACAVLSRIVAELPEGCSPDAARVWARSDEARADVLAVFPPKGANEERGVILLTGAIATLGYTKMCRHEIGEGNATAAAWAMHNAADALQLINNEIAGPLIDSALPLIAGRKLGRNNHLKNRHKEHLLWRDEFRRLKARHPTWSKSKIATEIGRTASPPRSKSQVLKVLRRFEKSPTRNP